MHPTSIPQRGPSNAHPASPRPFVSTTTRASCKLARLHPTKIIKVQQACISAPLKQLDVSRFADLVPGAETWEQGMLYVKPCVSILKPHGAYTAAGLAGTLMHSLARHGNSFLLFSPRRPTGDFDQPFIIVSPPVSYLGSPGRLPNIPLPPRPDALCTWMYTLVQCTPRTRARHSSLVFQAVGRP